MRYVFWILVLFSLTSCLQEQEQGEQSGTTTPKVIRWRTVSEHANFGFNVYRGLSENGPFVQVNTDPIQGAGTTDMPHVYEYSDESAGADTVYWYYVESISLNGDRRRITPIYPSKSKPAVIED